MFVKKIIKQNKHSDKQYTYYRLVHTYKIGNKVRHQNILSLGGLETLPRERHKVLADRIEELVTGNGSSLFPDNEPFADVEPLARHFADKIVKEKLFAFTPDKERTISKEILRNFQEVDIESVEQVDSKEIGGEWLVKQAFDKLEVSSILADSGLDATQIDIAQMLLTGKLLHPSSELEAERWLKENSGSRELYHTKEDISRYQLYGAAQAMYQNKNTIEKHLYNKLSTLFSGRSKIVVYDLTNMYFTGQMLSSDKANFGRSKQKQTGSKLIGLALSIDSLGFVRYSKFYNGNISEPGTFEDMLREVTCQLDTRGEKPVIVMDAGIATEENLEIIRSHKFNYDYVCVSRTIPRDYTQLSVQAETICDNRGNKIELTKVAAEGKDDSFLHIKSDQKLKKEASIDNKLTLRLEAQLQEIKDKLPKKGTLKKTEKVHEKVGRIKGQLSKIGWLYDITYTEDKEKGIVTDINWHRVKERERPKGEYFLRYTNNTISESEVWDVYNMTRDVEAVFRCLKTDLKVRPIHHQKDKYIEPHIWLGIMAYQIVNYIRKGLKENNIDYRWTTIIEKMKSMQTSIVSMNNKENEKIYLKLCTRPTVDQQIIFDSLNFKHRPYVRKKKVVPQL
ncbi:MAG: IS1634 family transposase [Pseudomonadota bacterium]|nr:IS1634 family transposase [Pseudomonadota bacterium]